MARNSDKIEVEGVVTKNLKGNTYEVEVEAKGNSTKVICTLSGKLVQNKIRIIVGDTVTVNISCYDLTKGIITYRGKKKY